MRRPITRTGTLGGGGGARALVTGAVVGATVVVTGATHLPRVVRVDPGAHPPTAHAVAVRQVLQFAEQETQELMDLKNPGKHVVHTVGEEQVAHPAGQEGVQAPAPKVKLGEQAVQVVAPVQLAHPVLQAVHTPRALRNWLAAHFGKHAEPTRSWVAAQAVQVVAEVQELHPAGQLAQERVGPRTKYWVATQTKSGTHTPPATW